MLSEVLSGRTKNHYGSLSGSPAPRVKENGCTHINLLPQQPVSQCFTPRIWKQGCFSFNEKTYLVLCIKLTFSAKKTKPISDVGVVFEQVCRRLQKRFWSSWRFWLRTLAWTPRRRSSSCSRSTWARSRPWGWTSRPAKPWCPSMWASLTTTASNVSCCTPGKKKWAMRKLGSRL